MKWTFTNDRPIYLQIIEQFQHGVVSGEITAGEKLPGVREMAAQAGVNPNTMQKALQYLELKGLVNTQRTLGRTVTEDENMINSLKKTLAQEQVQEFIKQMKILGFNKQDIIEILTKTQEE